MTIDEEYGVVLDATAGEMIWDDLTHMNAMIVRVSDDESGNRGYWLDNDYLGGGRHPWEISPPIAV